MTSLDDPTLGTLEGDEQTRTGSASPRNFARQPARDLHGLERIGRYLILDQLGAGGMGIVVSAYDPELDRKLAIKLIRFPGQAGERAGQRMLREAQALAKLSHPNVIAVYDVGTLDAQIYIAMEFVAGCTLTTWLARRNAQPFDWQAVLEPFVQAGRGLMAAHEAGLIHRDFKPDNVLVGDEGRVRVVDFGLARGAEREHDPSHEESSSPRSQGPSGSLLDREVTEFGSLLGTPSYMPPERLRGHGDDARADQYSFGVTLWEGLYGARPYTGATLVELFDAVLDGPMVEPASDRRAAVPDWLHRVLLRALEREPEQRFASMAELLAALQPPQPRSRWSAAIGLGLLAVVGVTIGARGLADDEQAAAPCTGFEQRLEGVWDDARRQQLRDALLASERSYAGPTADLLDTAFTDWATRWTHTRTDACEATALRGEQSPALLDLRMSCLDRRLAEFDAMVHALVLAGPEVIDIAPRTIAELPELDACSDPDQLGRTPTRPSDPALAESVDRLEHALDELDALWKTGRYVDGLARADALRSEIDEIDWTPLRARHARLHGVLLAKAQRTGEALAMTTEAIALARAIDDDRLAATATVDLLDTARYEVELADEFDRWARVAEAELGRLDEPRLAARMQIAIGDSHWERADHEGALAAYQQALALREAEFGPDAFEVAEARQKIADTLWPRGEVEQALAIYRRAQQTYTELLGPDHPALGNIDSDLGAVAWISGDYEAAVEHYQSALDRCLRTMPESNCTMTMSNLGATFAMQDKLDEARPWFERAVAAQRADPDRGIELPDSLDNLAELEKLTGNRERARALLEESRDLRLAKLGEQHPDYARSLLALAKFDLEDGHPELARTPLERALALREGIDVHVIIRARIHWDLAHALAALGMPRAEVEAQLDAARVDFVVSKIAKADELEAFEASAAELLKTR